MANHKPATAGTDILIGKLVVASNMYIAHALTINALTHTINLENMEMSVWSILPGVIE
jgi:hypothetical protein